MEVSNIKNTIEQFITFEISSNSEFSLKEFSQNETIFTILPNIKVDLTLKDINENNNLTFFVNRDSELNLKIVNSKGNRSFSLRGDVKENGSVNVYFADLSDSKVTLESNVILSGDNSKGSFKFCSVAAKNNVKKYDICFNQIGLKSSSLLEGYGVSLKNGVIDAKGVTHIEKGSVKSEANQVIKVILFDKESKAKASPTLKIDCDDIIANHACAIGSLNEDHIYYLQTRGISEQEARRLITMGYLLPIEDYFNEAEKEMINQEIEEIF